MTSLLRANPGKPGAQSRGPTVKSLEFSYLMTSERLNKISQVIAVVLAVMIFLRITTLVLIPLIQNQWWDLVFSFSLIILCILVASWQLFKQVRAQTSLKFLFMILAFLVVLLTIVAISLKRAVG
jgi:hypothetical protein